ncbi:MAG: hypothetical protein Ct9H90mP13_10870 [Pseudomonadota bacterium]|nr:MAG: hypothetical protein Ct9H90mP13_10870 [Pseudomonadota bacterium]
MGLEAIQLFDFVIPALIAGFFGIIFLWLIAPNMLPEERRELKKKKIEFLRPPFLSMREAFQMEKTLAEIQEKAGDGFNIDKIKRSESLFVAKIPQ